MTRSSIVKKTDPAVVPPPTGARCGGVFRRVGSARAAPDRGCRLGTAPPASSHARHLPSHPGHRAVLRFYDVHADCLDGLFRKRKRLLELFDAFRRLRRCYPRTKLFVVMDNLHQLHDHPRFGALLRKLRIHPAWTPTEASWLNLIEPHFGVLKRFTLANTDDPSHAVRRRRVYRYLRYRHRRVGTTQHPLAGVRRIRFNKLERH